MNLMCYIILAICYFLLVTCYMILVIIRYLLLLALKMLPFTPVVQLTLVFTPPQCL